MESSKKGIISQSTDGTPWFLLVCSNEVRSSSWELQVACQGQVPRGGAATSAGINHPSAVDAVVAPDVVVCVAPTPVSSKRPNLPSTSILAEHGGCNPH